MDLEGAHRLAFGRWVIYAEDIEKRGAHDWMDAVSAIPDVKVGIHQLRDGSRFSIVRRLEMRFPFGKCTPTIWLDGVRMKLFEGDWDLFAPLNQVRRIDCASAARAMPATFSGQ